MRILVLEDGEQRCQWFREYFDGEAIDFTGDPQTAINLLETDQYDRIYLDHDLLPEHYERDTVCNKTTGLCVAEWLASNRDNNKKARIYIHSRNEDGAMRMANALLDGNRDCNLFPFHVMSGKYI